MCFINTMSSCCCCVGRCERTEPARRRGWEWDEAMAGVEKGMLAACAADLPNSSTLLEGRGEGQRHWQAYGKRNWAGQVGGTRASPAQQR